MEDFEFPPIQPEQFPTALNVQKTPPKITVFMGGYSIDAELHIDGNQFGVFIGQDLQTGIVGFGPTLFVAVDNFKNHLSGLRNPVGVIL